MSVTDETPNPPGFGERLRILRELAGFPRQADFARATNLTPMTINRAERARRRTGDKALKAIVATLQPLVKFDEAWLVYGVGDPPNGQPPESVMKYLDAASGLAADIDPQVADSLRRFPWRSLHVTNPTTQQIALVRSMIETNLRMR